MRNPVPKNNSSQRLGAVGEWGLIKKILSLPPLFPRSMRVPPGDDAVVLNNAGQSVLSIDGLTEGTHFKLNWTPRLQAWTDFSLGRGLGWKLMGSSLSDLAAMGFTHHRWAMIFLGAPASTPIPFLSELQRGIREAARKYQCTLAGGDTVRAQQLTLVAAVGGDSQGRRLLKRHGARVGDLICIAGSVGDATVGLRLLENKIRIPSRVDRAYFIKRFFKVDPLFEIGRYLSNERGVTSAMDLSDALKDTVDIWAQASRVGARLQIEKIPVSLAYKRWMKVDPSLLSGGEDYSLFFTLHPAALPRLRKKLSFSVVGFVTSQKKGIVYTWLGNPIKPHASFQHFS
ncbi:MAG: Thiamine-monophosphate kinase [Elusimicrobia bacterium]|nr:Thiamine-monophosphate kinase [Elusimicrobiota bacterium]